MRLINVLPNQAELAMEIIDMAKRHLKEQGIDQWQTGYPDFACIESDIQNKKGYFIVDDDEILGYLFIDFAKDPAYDTLDGKWASDANYVVVHRLAFHENARGKGIADTVFKLVEELSVERNIHYFRVDTDEGNLKMQHILKKNGFSYCGTIYFDNTEKIAFDKLF